MATQTVVKTKVMGLLKDLRLPAMRDSFEQTIESAQKNNWSQAQTIF